MEGHIIGAVLSGVIHCTECGGVIPAFGDVYIEVKAENHIHFLCGSCHGNTDPTFCNQCITNPDKE